MCGEVQKIPQGGAAVLWRPDGAEPGVFLLVVDRTEDDAGEWHMAPRLMGQRDPLSCRDHMHQSIPSDVTPLETWRSSVICHAAHNMLENLRPCPTLPDEKGLLDDICPGEGFQSYERMRGRKGNHQGLVPKVPAMAVRHIGDIDDKCHIELAVAYHGESMRGRSLDDALLDCWMGRAIAPAQISKESRRDRAVYPDREAPDRAIGDGTGRPDSMVDLFDTCGNFGDEAAPGLGQPDAARTPLKQDDAKCLF